MKIALINGSPKVNGSASAILLTDLQKHLSNISSSKADMIEIGLHTPLIDNKSLDILASASAWIFAHPLYVDGIPAHFLSCLTQLEKMQWQNHSIHIYAIVNCGFYEGVQAKYALDVLSNWCTKIEFIWSGGIGVGGGGALAQMPSIENGHGPKAPIEKALCAMAGKILHYKTQENNYVSVAFPRFLYQMATQIGWRKQIKANGGKTKDLSAKQTD